MRRLLLAVVLVLVSAPAFPLTAASDEHRPAAPITASAPDYVTESHDNAATGVPRKLRRIANSDCGAIYDGGQGPCIEQQGPCDAGPFLTNFIGTCGGAFPQCGLCTCRQRVNWYCA